MTTQDIENALISRLSSSLPSLNVVGFPSDFENYQLTHPKGAILVQYFQSEFSEPKAINMITQVRNLQFRLILATPNLRADAPHAFGAYGYLDAIRQSITGFQITGLSKMFPVRERFAGERNGVWYYEIIVQTSDRNQEV